MHPRSLPADLPTQTPRPRWLVLLLAISLLFGLLSLGLEPLSGLDLGLHVRMGELIANERTLPATDPFSFTATHVDVLAQSWLPQIGLFLVDRTLGVPGLVLLKLLALALAFGLLALAIRGDALLSALILLACAVVAHSRIQLQPDMLCWALIGGLLLAQRHKSGPAVTAILLLWANCHASFILAVAFSLIWAIEQFFIHRDRDWLIWAVLFVCVPCLNPYGPQIYPFFLKISGHTGGIGSWRQYPLDSLYLWVLLAYCAALIVQVINGSRNRMFDGLRLALLLGLAASAARMGIVAMLYLAPMAARRYGPLFARLQGRTATAFGCTLACAALLGGGYLTYSGQAFRLDTNRAILPQDAADFVERHGLSGRMFNDFNYGGYLIWRLWPERKVFIDGRLEVYGDSGLLEDYNEIANCEPGWEMLLDTFEIDSVLVSIRRPVARCLTDNRQWDLVYFGQYSAVFIRNREMPQVRRIEQITPWGKRDTGDLEQAISEARYLLAENPHFTNGHLILAVLLEAHGDYQGAARSLERFIELEPDGRKLDQVRQLIASVEQHGASIH
ncbi:MAG: tetratricopeptide repeat protein [Candidatus Alcyoniella australis]|nr:tetratricopeptide repeat protein [Candidatus Alcyoniella australis]